LYETPKLAVHIVRMNKLGKFKTGIFIEHKVSVPVN